MNAHNHLHRRNARPEPVADPQQTIVSVVYVTASPTFTGAIAGYTTIGATARPQSSKPAAASDVSASIINSSIEVDSATPSPSTSAPHTTLRTATSLPAALSSTTTVASTIPIIAATTSNHVVSHSSATATAASATSTPSSSSGMSGAGKAGLAVGIILLLGAVLAMVLFCFKKQRKSRRGERMEDEKHEFQSISTTRASSPEPQQIQRTMTHKSITSAKAPRLSLKRASQFLPDLTIKPQRMSRGTPLDDVKEASSRPTTSHSNSQDNPFGNHAEIDAANANGPAVVDGVIAGGELVALNSRGTSKHGPKPMDFTSNGPFRGPPSPANTEFSTTSAATSPPPATPMGNAIAAAGGPPNSAVHRVQLDFNPSMGDELELKAGQLVRLLHEYDDGWAMCIRLDRTQQGVVPRTCLSTRPVKPRPQQNGPRGPPPGQRALTPQQQRPMTPSGLAPAPFPSAANRPMTPGGQRPAAPSEQSNSPPREAMRYDLPSTSPPSGPLPLGPVNRKPVPGQAI